MEAKQIKLDGQDILKDGISGIYYTQKEWRNGLQTSDQSNDRAGSHGRDTSATSARIRVITLEGIIDRIPNPLIEQTSTEYLERLFTLQGNPSIIVPRTLYVKDIYDREWELSVKVKEPCLIQEGDGEYKGSHWKWRAVLESIEDPTYLSYGELSESGIEGSYGGLSMPVGGFSLDAGISFSDAINLVNIYSSGNRLVYPRFEFTVTGTINTPLRIKNIGTNEYFSLDISGTAGDTIIIDSLNQSCKKNGTDVTANRLIGSLWPTAFGDTNYLIDDADGGILGSDFSLIVFYKNALL